MRIFAAVMCSFLMVTPLWAQEDACAVQAELTQLIVDERRAGTAAPEAVAAVTAVLSKAQIIYEAALPALVEWIYLLPEDQVNDSVAQDYLTQCQEAGLN